MKILMVSSFLPYPLFSGGQIRLFNLIKELSAKHEITLVCEMRDNQTREDIAAVEKICKRVITVPRRKQWTLGNILKTSYSSNSFLMTGHKSSEMKKKIKDELDNSSFDLIHVETYYVMQNLPNTLTSQESLRNTSEVDEWTPRRWNLPIVLAEHNIEYKVYKKFVDQAPVFLRPILNLDISKIRKEEEDFWIKANKLIAVSKDDKEVMERIGLKPIMVANGVDTEKFCFYQKEKSKKKKAKRILFIGDFKWLQNRDSVKFIIEEIWPEISSKFKVQSSKFDTKLWIVGRKIPGSIKSLTGDLDIIFDEESSAKPTEQIFQEADVLLAPIRVGGGTSYKILESMSCGTPVVTTFMSAESLEATDGENIMVSDDAFGLAGKTLKLLEDHKTYEKIAKNGRALIEQKYTWGKIVKDLEQVYKDAVDK